MNLKFLLFSGKNPKWKDYAVNFTRIVIPNIIYRLRLKSHIKSIKKRPDYQYILDRVRYYNKLQNITPIGNPSQKLEEHTYNNSKTKKEYTSVYFFDSYEFTRYFNPKYKGTYRLGDVT